jgi:hypothetical protein
MKDKPRLPTKESGFVSSGVDDLDGGLALGAAGPETRLTFEELAVRFVT